MTAVTVNGERLELTDDATVASAVREAGVIAPERGVAVAVDGEVVPRGEWDGTALSEGQQVEVVRAVQGG
jgi:sulfur carrier protein